MVSDFKFFHGIIHRVKMRAVWTPQIEHDLNEYHNINAEAELTRMLSDEIANAIDDDILQRLINETTENIDRTASYLNHWLNIGENRA